MMQLSVRVLAVLACILWAGAAPGLAADPVSPPAPQAPAQAPAPGLQAPNLPPGVLARVNGREVTVQDYTAYLFATLGRSKLNEFLDRLLTEEEAKRLGVIPTPEEVEERVEARVESAIRALHQGSVDRFQETLAKRGLTMEEHKQKLRQENAYSILEEKCILKDRKVTEQDLRQRFEQTYGEGGVQYEIRHILVSTRPRPQNPGEPRPPAMSEQDARLKAEALSKELQGGADFVQLVRSSSDDELTRRNDGRIAQYRKGYRGQEFHDAVAKLTEENRLSGVVRSPQGFHLIQLIEKKLTRFEDRKDEIQKVLVSQPPTPQERATFIKALREKAKLEM